MWIWKNVPPFPKGRTKATAVGKITHLYLCGPLQVANLEGAVYFVYLQTTYPKQKSEAADRLKNMSPYSKTRQATRSTH